MTPADPARKAAERLRAISVIPMESATAIIQSAITESEADLIDALKAIGSGAVCQSRTTARAALRKRGIEI